MKQKFPFLLSFLFIYSKLIFSQLTPGGIYSIGPNPPYTQPGGFPYTGNFTSLSAAVSQLNLSSATGHYILEFQNDYTPASESFPIVITYVGAPTAVATIRPRSDVPISGISVMGSVSGGPVVFLNGASYVNIDGRPGASGTFSTRRLTIQNNAAASVTNASISFVAASHNRISACTLKVNDGNVVNLGINGCSHNRIHSNYMAMATTTHPAIGVNSAGSLALINKDDTISSNIIAYPTSIGINVGINSTSFVVSENHVGGGLSLNMPTNRNFYGIRVASGGGHKIFGNIIGDDFSSSNAIYENINTSGRLTFCGIQLSASASGPINLIQANKINRITLRSAVNALGLQFFTGVEVSSGPAIIGGPNAFQGNLIGDNTSAAGNIKFEQLTSTSNNFNISGIRCVSASASVGEIRNNQIGGFLIDNNNGQPATFRAIYFENNVSVPSPPCIIRGNLIGSTISADNIHIHNNSTGNQTRLMNGIAYINNNPVIIDSNTISSISCSSFGSANSSIEGIVLSGASSGTNIIRHNTILSLKTFVTNSQPNVPAVVGIRNLQTAGTQIIEGNKIFKLSSFSTTRVFVTGIMSGNSPSVVSNILKNSISQFIATADTSSLVGIYNFMGSGTVANNQISLTNGSLTSDVNIYNIWCNSSSPINYFYNTCYIGGSAGPLAFFATTNFLRTNSSPLQLKNNIFYNERNSPATAKHYNIAELFTTLGLNWASGASDYNLFVNSGASNLFVGRWSSDCNFSTWQIQSGGDLNSIYQTSSLLPSSTLFANPLGGDLKTMICNPPDDAGIPVAVADDYYGTSRHATTPTIGATELNAGPMNLVLSALPSSPCALSPVTFSVTGVNLGNFPIYDFRVNGVTVQIGPSATYSTIGLSAGDIVKCYVTSSTDCAIPAYDSSNAINIINCSVIQWTGLINTDWHNPGNWSPTVVPNSCAVSVIIPTSPPGGVFPVINGMDATVGDMTMQSGSSLNVFSGHMLKVCGDWTGSSTTTFADVTGAGRVVLLGSGTQNISGRTRFTTLRIRKASGIAIVANVPSTEVEIEDFLELQLGLLNAGNDRILFISNSVTHCAILDDFSPGFSGSIIGSIRAQRTYASATHFFLHKQHYFSSPVNNMPFSQFAPLYGSDGVAVTPTATCDETYLESNSNYGNVFEYDESNVTYCYLEAWRVRSAGNAVNGRGYSVVKQGAGTLTVNGVPNLSNYTIGGLNNSGWSYPTAQGNTYDGGWHLLGNPYLASLDLDYSINGAFDDNILVLHTHGPFQGTYQPLSMSGPGLLAPFQGFFARKTMVGGPSATFSIQNPWRSRTGTAFHKHGGHQMSLLVQGNGYADITYFNFNPQATNGYDAAYDGGKFLSFSGQPTIYSLIGGTWASVNTNTDVESTPRIPVGFNPGADGTFQITGSGFDELPNTTVYLEDRKEKVMHNLTQMPEYTFTAYKGDHNERFMLHFRLETPSGMPKATSQYLRMFPNPASELLYVETNMEGPVKVAITDMKGRIVLEQTFEKRETIDISLLASAVYQVHLSGQNGKVVERLVKD